MTSKQLQIIYGVPVYRNWKDVPEYLHTRTSALREKIVIPVKAKPDAIKNATSIFGDKVYLLFNILKYRNVCDSTTPPTPTKK